MSQKLAIFLLLIFQLHGIRGQASCGTANCPPEATCTRTRLEGEPAYQCQCLGRSQCYKAGCEDSGTICQSKTGRFADFINSLLKRANNSKLGQLFQQMSSQLLRDGSIGFGLRRSKRYTVTKSVARSLQDNPRGALLANPLSQGQECQETNTGTCGCQVDGKFLQANTFFSRKPDCTEFCECLGTNNNKFRCSDFEGCPHGLQCRSSQQQGFYECVPICNGRTYDLQTQKCCHPADENGDNPLNTGCIVDYELDCCQAEDQSCARRGLHCASLGEDHYACR